MEPFDYTSPPIPLVDHPMFGPAAAPQRPDQLTWLINRLALRDVDAWRGQARADWPVDPSVVRSLRHEEPDEPPSEQRVRTHERQLIESAEMKKLREVGNGDLELLARLRHYGGATRLLDATRNAYVALWFACAAKAETELTGTLIGFRLHHRHDTDQLDSADLKQPIDDLLERADGRLQWWHPADLSPRIPAQRALLAFGNTVDEPWGSICLGEGSVARRDDPPCGNVPGAAIILIPPELKLALNRAWESVFGYDQETLFPDVEGFAAAHAPRSAFVSGRRRNGR